MHKLQVCVMARPGPGASCGKYHGDHLLAVLTDAVSAAAVPVIVEPVKCLLYCQQGPNVRLLPEGKIWHKVDSAKVEEIISKISTLK